MFKKIYFVKTDPKFVGSPWFHFKIYQKNSLEHTSLLGKSLMNFVSPNMKLHNWSCNNSRFAKKSSPFNEIMQKYEPRPWKKFKKNQKHSATFTPDCKYFIDHPVHPLQSIWNYWQAIHVPQGHKPKIQCWRKQKWLQKLPYMPNWRFLHC